jgi:hypothetical protein
VKAPDASSLLTFYQFFIPHSGLNNMTSAARRRLAALSEQLVNPIGDQGKFEDIPILKKIAPDSTGPRVKGKVIIITGQLCLETHTANALTTCRD